MGLFTPAWQTKDIQKAEKAVNAAIKKDDQKQLARIACEAVVQSVKISAIKALKDQSVISAIPMPDPTVKMDRVILEGSIPSPANPPSGCKFHTRCSKCMERCKIEVPEEHDMGNGHIVACHLYDESADSDK